MKIFVSWSGERSQSVANILHGWLPLVLHFVEPWLSQSDIEPGERWASEVSKELEASNFGIICVTRENTVSPWILFEAGALTKSLQQGRVIPLLLDVEFKDISGPLAQFQAKKVDESGLKDLVSSINKLSDSPIPDPRLSQLFSMSWPSLTKQFEAIPKGVPAAKHNRPQQEILEDLVTGVRNLEVRVRETAVIGSDVRRRRNGLNPMMINEVIHGSRLGPRDPVKYLLIGSVLRESFPWLYELGADAYRASLDGSRGRKADAVRRFAEALHIIRRGPFMEEAGLDKNSYIFMREMEHMLILEDEALPDDPKLARTKPTTQTGTSSE
jgi:hypothetical protein